MGGKMSDKEASQVYRNSVLSEIAMLVDYVAANAGKRLSDLKVDDPATNSPGKILEKINELQQKVANTANSPVPVPKQQPNVPDVPRAGNETQLTTPNGPLTAADLTWLQLVRDALSSLSSPASGLTVAYTALVTGRQRHRKSMSRETLAQAAYPGLVKQAAWHRWTQHAFLVFAVIITLSAVWESAKVALGKSLLQDLEGLRTQQAGIAQEKVRIEATLDTPRQGALKPSELTMRDGTVAMVSLSAFGLCDRRYALAYYLKPLASG
jgi:hypothetical protein